MLKKISIIAAAILTVVVSFMAIAWYAQANQMRKSIEEAVATLNKEAPYFSYSSIETSGFPFKVNISIVNPRFTGNVGDFLRSMSLNSTPDGQLSSPFDGVKEWNEDRQLHGSITFSINAMSDRYSVSTSGTWKGTSTIKNNTIATTATGEATCALELAHGSGISGEFWDFHVLDKKGEQLANDLRLLDCNFPAGTYNEESTGAVLASSGDARFYISQSISGAQRNIRVYMKYADAEFTTKGDELISLYMLAFDPTRPVFSNFAGYGKQNGEIDATYTGPLEFKGGNNEPMNITLSKFDVSNALFTQTAALQFINTPAGDQRDSKLTLRWEFFPGEMYDELLKVQTRKMLHEIYVSNDPRFNSFKSITSKFDEDGAYAVISPAIPKLFPLGKFVQAVDGSFKGAADFKSGDFTLSGIELSVSPYGITGSGSASMQPGQMVPKMNFSFTCRSCITMIDDATAYAARVHKMVSTFDATAGASLELKPADVAGFKNFLTALAVQAGNDFGYTLVGDGTMNITLNGKRIDEIQVLYNQHMMPPAAAK